MPKQRIPAAVDLHIERVYGAVIGDTSSYIKNGIVEKYSEDRVYVTQRPSLDVFEDESAFTNPSEEKGRAIHYWDYVSDRYIVNGQDVFNATQDDATPMGQLASAGTQKCYFVELEGASNKYLILTDPEAGDAYYIASGAATTLVQISPAGFPTTLAHGVVVLDGYIFLMTPDGEIWQSANEDPTTWSSLNTIYAERETDDGIYLGKHSDHLVALGARTIEFFYDAANTSGTVLARRPDIAYNTGCADGNSVWCDEDTLFFVGTNISGGLGVYTIERFKLNKISSPSVDAWLTQAKVKETAQFVASGFSAMGRPFYILTLYTEDSSSDVVPQTTIVYDTKYKIWYLWEFPLSNSNSFPLMGWSIRTGTTARAGEGIMYNGDLVTINDDMWPLDTVESAVYVEAGYVEDDYVVSVGEDGSSNISLEIRIPHIDFDTRNSKFAYYAEIVGDYTQNSQTTTVSWSDNIHNNYNSGRTIDMSSNHSIRRLGRFDRRNWKLEYAGDEAIRLEAIELDIGGATH